MVLVEMVGKVLAQDFESHAPTSSGILTVALLPSICFSYEKLFIRKVYGRKEGNSKRCWWRRREDNALDPRWC